MSDCPKCGSDDTYVLKGAPPDPFMRCRSCSHKWTHNIPECAPGDHSWTSMGRNTLQSGGIAPYERCNTCGVRRENPAHP